MLIELRVHNYAIIEQLAVRLESGLNVLTGETGAGKSIIVGALSLLLGERASSDSVRAGAERAVIEGVFDISGRDALIALLGEHGIEAEDGLLILRRELAAEGRSRAWVNGAASTAGLVGELGRQLVDLHGQHEHQTLVRTEEQRSILDAYGGSTILADQVGKANARARDSAARLEELERRAREVELRADYLRHQAEEIEAAELSTGEEEELDAEATRLEHAEELSRLSGELHQELYQAEDAIAARIDGLRRSLEHLIRIDVGLTEWREVLDNAYYGLEELGRRMGEYASLVEHDPARLDEIRRRQDLLFRLKSKYGPDLSAVIESGRMARQELDTLDRAHLDRRTLTRELGEARGKHLQLCGELSEHRREAALRLDEEITAVLPELGMSGGRFSTVVTPVEPAAHGADAVEFRVTVNEGFEPRPLARVASGGELSRIMLALKSVLARVDRIPTLVFDEIDAGIGGRVAHHVAEKLKRVAAHHQVFVITHLAQIASRADHHLLVEKVSKAGAAATALRELHDEARVHELARLLGGDPESAVSIEHAREMLAAR
jgi:DNA repair protein RecN (Recombination protein N)